MLPKRTKENKRNTTKVQSWGKRRYSCLPVILLASFLLRQLKGPTRDFTAKEKFQRWEASSNWHKTVLSVSHEVNSGIATMSLPLYFFSSSNINCVFKLFSHTDLFPHVKQCIWGLPLIHNKYSNLPIVPWPKFSELESTEVKWDIALHCSGHMQQPFTPEVIAIDVGLLLMTIELC